MKVLKHAFVYGTMKHYINFVYSLANITILYVHKLIVSLFILMLSHLWFSVFLGTNAKDQTFAMLPVLNDIPTFILLIHNVLTQ